MAAAGAGKSFEEIINILNEVRLMFENDEVEKIEDARNRGRVFLYESYDVLIKEKGIGNFHTLARTFPNDIKNKLYDKLAEVTKAFVEYMYRHRDLYPPGKFNGAHGGKRRHKKSTHKKLKKSRRRKTRK